MMQKQQQQQQQQPRAHLAIRAFGTRSSFDGESGGASFSREKNLHEVLLQHGLHYVRPLGRGTFGRVVLARTGA
jgi:hypothetical protein